MERQAFFNKIREAIRSGENEAANAMASEAMKNGISAEEALNQCTEEMRAIGKAFESGEIFLPEVMIAAETFKSVAALLAQQMSSNKERKFLGTVVIGTVQGDVHDLGKNIVATMLEAEGFKVFNLGRDVPSGTFIAKAKETNADILGASALMTVTLLEQKKIAAELKDANLETKYFVGGSAVSDEWAESIGAIRGEDAMDTVSKAKRVLGL
jgi:trimethylamine corrinoid protein